MIVPAFFISCGTLLSRTNDTMSILGSSYHSLFFHRKNLEDKRPILFIGKFNPLYDINRGLIVLAEIYIYTCIQKKDSMLIVPILSIMYTILS